MGNLERLFSYDLLEDVGLFTLSYLHLFLYLYLANALILMFIEVSCLRAVLLNICIKFLNWVFT